MKRYSKNREAILECIRSTKEHPSAEWIYAKLKGDYPNMSLATVYRNLAQLKEAGVIHSMGIVSGYEHFDGDLSSHHHMICSKCGRIIDVDNDERLTELISSMNQEAGVSIQEIKFMGLCGECSENRC